MEFMNGRVERFRDLIGQGKFDSAIRRMKDCYVHGLRANSTVVELLSAAKLIDAQLNEAVKALESAKQKSGDEQTQSIRLALSHIKEFEREVGRIPKLAHAIVTMEKDLEQEEKSITKGRGFFGRLFGRK